MCSGGGGNGVSMGQRGEVVLGGDAGGGGVEGVVVVHFHFLIILRMDG